MLRVCMLMYCEDLADVGFAASESPKSAWMGQKVLAANQSFVNEKARDSGKMYA